MLQYYKLRVDDEFIDEECQKVLEEKYLQNYVRVFEVGVKTEKPHFHYYVETPVQERTIRAFIRDKCGLRSKYSLKVCEHRPIEYLSYLWKDQMINNTMVDTIGDIDFVTNAKKHAEEVQANIKQKKENQLPLWKQCQIFINKKYPDDHPFRYSYEEVTTTVVKFMIDRDILIRDFQIKSIVRTIVLHNSPGRVKQYISSIVEELKKF